MRHWQSHTIFTILAGNGTFPNLLYSLCSLEPELLLHDGLTLQSQNWGRGLPHQNGGSRRCVPWVTVAMGCECRYGV